MFKLEDLKQIYFELFEIDREISRLQLPSTISSFVSITFFIVKDGITDLILGFDLRRANHVGVSLNQISYGV